MEFGGRQAIPCNRRTIPARRRGRRRDGSA